MFRVINALLKSLKKIHLKDLKKYITSLFELTRYWQYLPKISFDIFRIISLIDYKLANGFSFYPQAINLELTARCNLRCKMCWLWGKQGIGKYYTKEEISFETIKRVVDEISCFRPTIYLQGGEILVRKDAIKIMEYIHKKRLICGFTTNGTLITKENVKRIVNSVHSVSISIDGPQEIHNQIRGDEAFEKAINGISNLISAREDRFFPIIKINTLIPSLPEDSISHLISLAEDLKIDLLQFGQFQFLQKSKAKAHIALMKKLFNIDCKAINGYVWNPDINIEEIENKISLVNDSNTHLLTTFTPSISSKADIEKWYTLPARKLRKRCLFPWFSVIIKSNGDVVPCGEYRHPEYTIGNIKENSFKELWNNEKAKSFRNALKKYGFFPGCDRCCGLNSYAR